MRWAISVLKHTCHYPTLYTNTLPPYGPRTTMDPLSVTASVIAITTLTWQSCKAAYDLVDGLAEAPQAIARSKNSLIET